MRKREFMNNNEKQLITNIKKLLTESAEDYLKAIAKAVAKEPAKNVAELAQSATTTLILAKEALNTLSEGCATIKPNNSEKKLSIDEVNALINEKWLKQ